VSRARRLLVVLWLNLALVAGLVIVGVTAHSVGVLAEGGDYLLDAAGVGVALVALRLTTRPRGPGRAAVYPKATSAAALINAGWLLALELLVVAVATDRLLTRVPRVAGLPVLVMSGIAALVMAAGALILRADRAGESGAGEDLAAGGEAAGGEAGAGEGGAGELDLSVAAVLLDTTADAAAAAGVAAAGGLILIMHGWFWLDPAVACAVAAVVAYHAAGLIRKALRSLRAPTAGSAPAAATGDRAAGR
jgi:cobalt-zinc-cadmium efflux system protein